MNRSRLTSWASLAALALAAGCQSCDYSCNGGGFFSRLAARRRPVCCEGPVVGTPVSTMPLGGGCCEGGPILGDPGIYAPGTMAPAINGVPPFNAVPPMTTLPPPSGNTAPPPLAPVPGTAAPGTATPTPAPASPSSRGR
jgi:hypothetical protein